MIEIVDCLFASLGGGGMPEVAGCGCGASCWVGLSVAFVTTGGGDLAVVGACVEAAVLTACWMGDLLRLVECGSSASLRLRR